MKKYFLCILLAMVFVSGCSKSPMQKLASNKIEPDMTNEYWQKEYANKTNLWNDALAYCQNNKKKPNCAPVMKIYLDAKWGNTEITGKLDSHPLHLP